MEQINIKNNIQQYPFIIENIYIKIIISKFIFTCPLSWYANIFIKITIINKMCFINANLWIYIKKIIIYRPIILSIN